MAVNLNPPDPVQLLPVAGVELGYAEAGIRKGGRTDVTLIRLAPGARIAGVFTQNSFAAAPVQVCQRRLAGGGEMRALLVNAGNANCGTGEAGVQAAERSCAAVASAIDCRPEQVLPFSTGVILEPLPVERIEAALPRCVATLAATNWATAATAIMTTDTVAKAASRAVEIDGRRVAITGIAKGVGMLQPNMATMLAFIACDAAIAPAALRAMLHEVTEASFNRVTVDGDTSTNDSFVLIATGRAGNREIASGDERGYQMIKRAVTEVAQTLAQAIARDGEGATKFITIRVGGAATQQEAVRVAKAIAHSPLVKTAFFASDPNLGRLLMAIGNAGIGDLDTGRVELWLGDVKVIDRGARAATYREEDGKRVMQPAEIAVRVALGRGAAETTVWTCDFSYDYVKINAEYRTKAANGSALDRLVERIESVLDRVEPDLPAPSPPVDWRAAIAFRWRKRDAQRWLAPVAHPHKIRLNDLRGVDRQKSLVEQNTKQFVAGRTANNVLLTGARGTGKSSLVKAVLNRFHRDGLRLIEVEKQDLVDLPDIVDLVAARPERFVVFCDDLSFEASEPGYKALKVALDGSIATASDNVIIYATSNRRHLMPEFMQENLEYHRVGEEIHPGETSEEKISLSERFGLWVSFYPFDQDDYLNIVAHWLHEMGCSANDIERARNEALQWALARGSRSGRVAWQFARDYAGRKR